MQKVYGDIGFYWWVGVVEDRDDPLMLGRCRVRIAGYHTSNVADLPIQDLPWAYPMQPITSAAISGIGVTPLGPVPGTWVVGFFRDGADGQQPIMMGTLAGIPQKEYHEELQKDSARGFKDPNGEYPKTDYLENNESDVNRLARNQNIKNTIVQKKDDEITSSVETAMNGNSWSQPETAYAAKYPYNHVFESESGHVFEVDDTPNAERITMYHKAGTFVDIDNNGTMVKKIVGDSYEIYLRNNNVLVRGAANLTVDGACNIYVKNNCNFEVDGDLKIHSHGDLELKSGKKLTIASNLSLNLHSNLFINLSSTSIITSSPVITSLLPPVPTILPVEVTLSSFPYIFGTSRRDALTTELDALSENEGNAETIRAIQEQAIRDGILTQEEIDAPVPDGLTEEPDTTPPTTVRASTFTCGSFAQRTDYPLDLKLSEYFTIGDLTVRAAAHPGRVTGVTSFGRSIDPQPLSKQQIACNLKALAENILDPIKKQYPDMLITSGFRNFRPSQGAVNSQHMVGQAVDLQFISTNPKDYHKIASWIKNNLDFDQLLLEYEPRRNTTVAWIHVSFNPRGNRKTFGTFWNHRYAIINGRLSRESIVNMIV